MIVVVREPSREPEVREIGRFDAMQTGIAHGDFSMLELVPDGPPGLDPRANEEGEHAS